MDEPEYENGLPELVITASGLNCQPLMAGHVQRNAALKFLILHKI